MVYIAGAWIPRPRAIGVQHPEGALEAVDKLCDFQLTRRPHFYTLYRTLRTSGAPLWRDIGLFLELDQAVLDTLETEGHKAPTCLEKLLSLWFKEDDPPPTKSAIIKVLKDLKLTAEAEKLRGELVPIPEH